MSSQPRRGGGVAVTDKRSRKQPELGIVAKLNNSYIVSKGKEVASDAVIVSKKFLSSTGKAAWIASTTFLILVFPLMYDMVREQQINDRVSLEPRPLACPRRENGSSEVRPLEYY